MDEREKEILHLKVVLGAILELMKGDAFSESITCVAIETICRIHGLDPEVMRAMYNAWVEESWKELRSTPDE